MKEQTATQTEAVTIHSWGEGGGQWHSGNICLPPLSSEFESQPGVKWESWQLLADGQQFTVQNLDQLYVLVSSAHKTTHHDMTCTVMVEILKTQINSNYLFSK